MNDTEVFKLPDFLRLQYNHFMTYVAAIQMVSTDTVGKNLELTGKLIEEAAAKKAKLITLPENFPLMGKHDEDRLAITETFNDGPLQLFLSEQSKRYKVWLLGGTIPLVSDNPEKVFATSLLFNPNGECIARYDKIHLFDVVLDENDGESYRESKTFKSGNDIVVAQTEIGNIGLSVCYDLRFPEMYRIMHNESVQIITAPSAFTATTGKAHWETLLKTRAIENLCYLIASNQGGVHANGRETWGHSMIVDPWGEILAEVKEETGIAIAKIDIEKQTNLRKRFPVLTHRKLN